jgi:hypothetical protein
MRTFSGLPDFSSAQHTKNGKYVHISNDLEIYQIAIKLTNDLEIRAIKYTNIIHSKAHQNIPKFCIFGTQKYLPSGNPFTAALETVSNDLKKSRFFSSGKFVLGQICMLTCLTIRAHPMHKSIPWQIFLFVRVLHFKGVAVSTESTFPSTC